MVVVKELSTDSQIGDIVTWRTIGGLRFVGRLKEWDSNVAIVVVDEETGKEKAVET